MPIYIDISAAAHGRAGLGRYAASLARALWRQRPGRFALFHNRDRGTHIVGGLEEIPTRTVHVGYKAWRMAVWLGQLARADFGRLVPDAELFHATEHLLMPLRGVPTVLTVHDLIYRLFPRYHKRLNYVYLNAAMPLYVRRADAIIAISRSTKRDLVRLYRVPPEKVTVVYEAPAPHFQPARPEAIAAVRRRYSLPDRFMLTVGTIEPRKNLSRLVDALALVRRIRPDLELVIAGTRGWLDTDFFRHLEGHACRESVLMLGYVPDGDLPALYAAADLCVVPSLYEGFGLPVLEAMACGTPVACSRVSSLPELGGDAAAYFDPTSVEEMSAGISRVLGDESLGEAMRVRGLARAARFSWERTARETMAVYEKVLGSWGE